MLKNVRSNSNSASGMHLTSSLNQTLLNVHVNQSSVITNGIVRSKMTYTHQGLQSSYYIVEMISILHKTLIQEWHRV